MSDKGSSTTAQEVIEEVLIVLGVGEDERGKMVRTVEKAVKLDLFSRLLESINKEQKDKLLQESINEVVPDYIQALLKVATEEERNKVTKLLQSAAST